jgi:hypothetical protein
MILSIIGLIIIYILYALLVKGLLYKIILGVFGWIGMYWYLSDIEDFQTYPFNNDTITWAALVPTVILLMAMAHTKEE